MTKKERILSKLAGILFFTVVVVYIISIGLFDDPLHELNNREYGIDFPQGHEKKKLYIGFLLEVVNAFGVIGIASCISTLLWKSNPFISISYLAFRIIECCILLVGIVFGIIIVRNASGWNNSQNPWKTTTGLLHKHMILGKDTCLHLGILACGISGVVMTSHLLLFNRGGGGKVSTRLCPWWIALWGCVAYFLTCIGCLVDIANSFELSEERIIGDLIHAPTMLFEVVIFPFWLIFRGFGNDQVDDVHEE